jgi:hypothetical protein
MKRVGSALLLGVVVSFGLSSREATSAPTTTGGFGPFTGVWSFHTFSLEVTAAGNAYATYRMYTWCSPHRRFGCDAIIGSQIYDGGVWWARLGTPGKVQVVGTIYASADSSVQGTLIVLKRLPHDFMLFTWWLHGPKRQLTLCGPDVPVPTSRCGA